MPMSSKHKIGILGGTFDPIHMGHLFLAETAYDRLGLDKVLLMPAPDPYHRIDKDVSSAEHRAAMVRLAVADNDHLEFSDFEMQITGPTFTADTLSAFCKEYPDADIYLIIGGDSLFSIEHWKDPEKVFSLATIVSSKRENEIKGASGSCLPSEMIDSDHDGIDDRTQATSLHDEFLIQADYLRNKFGARIIDIDIPNMEISSSDIIKRIREGRSVRYLLPDPVIEYIVDNGLYL